MFGIICVALLCIVLLTIRVSNTTKFFDVTPKEEERSLDIDERRRKAAILPNDLYLTEIGKEDKVLGGVWGVSSKSHDLRTPYHISNLEMQKKFMDIMKRAKESTDETQYKTIVKEVESLYTEFPRSNKVLSNNQKMVLEAIQDGQGIPTATEEDALEDEQLSVKELKDKLPQLAVTQMRPDLFNFSQYSIQKKGGSAEKLMELSLQTHAMSK